MTRTYQVVRFPEPGEVFGNDGLVATEVDKETYAEGQFGVYLRHEDDQGSTLIPWHRILRVDIREVAE